MTTTVRPDTPFRETLPAGRVFSIVAPATVTGRVGRLADTNGAAVPDVPVSAFQPILAGTTLRVGPFRLPTRHTIEAYGGPLTVTTVDAEPGLPISGAPTDVVEFFGAGVPVSYTDGDPVATGEGVAGIGSRYTNLTSGTLYLNTGTRAQPTWTQLAPVAP
jgi:hypothetical protein